MGIKIVRTPSETPNITNVDDIIPFRYAYGNQNGYVIGRGSQLDGSYESGEFTVGSGRAVIQGVEVDIDANGISTILDTASETRYFKIYLKVNLANDVAVLESYYSTVSYDEITDPTSSDLLSSGDAYLLLYTLKLNGTTQVEKNKVVKSIEYINKNTTIENANKVRNVDFSDDNVSQFGDYIVSKKRLLWSGDFSFGSSNKNFTELSASDIIGKNIEVIGRQLTYAGAIGRFDWVVQNFPNGSEYIYSDSFINTAAKHLTTIRASMLVSSQSGVRFNSATRTHDLNSGDAQSASEAIFHIYKIYEIIE